MRLAGAAHPCHAGKSTEFSTMTKRMRFERAAAALAAGRKVSVEVSELTQGVQAWLQELRGCLLVDHLDPGDEVTYKVYVTVKDGKAVAAAKLVLR